MIGNQIQTLIENTQEAGSQTVQWDGMNEHAYRVPPGMYIIQLKRGDQVSSIKIMKK